MVNHPGRWEMHGFVFYQMCDGGVRYYRFIHMGVVCQGYKEFCSNWLLIFLTLFDCEGLFYFVLTN